MLSRFQTVEGGLVRGSENMREHIALGEKLKTLERLAEVEGEDRIIDQTLTKLLDYATEHGATSTVCGVR